MSTNKIRSILYSLAKYLGDFAAISKSITQKSAKPLQNRLFRRIYGKIAARGFNIFK
jgi:hypothetical protein